VPRKPAKACRVFGTAQSRLDSCDLDRKGSGATRRSQTFRRMQTMQLLETSVAARVCAGICSTIIVKGYTLIVGGDLHDRSEH
jgi:hypothetical protein